MLRTVTTATLLATMLLARPASASAASARAVRVRLRVLGHDCSEFNPPWTFHDDFTEFFHDRGHVWVDTDGNPLRIHTSGHKAIDLETGEPIAIRGSDDAHGAPPRRLTRSAGCA
jgi:hypothetical protein